MRNRRSSRLFICRVIVVLRTLLQESDLASSSSSSSIGVSSSSSSLSPSSAAASLAPAWVGPLADFYQDYKCANVGIHTVSLAACQLLCAQDPSPPPPGGCNAINWGPDQTGKTAGGCVLRACKTEADKLHPDGPSVHDIHGYYCNGTRKDCATDLPAVRPWLGGKFGRVRFEFNTSSASNSTPAVLTVPWRRRDQLPGPNHTAMLVTCASGQPVDNALGTRSRYYLRMAFSPTCGAGTYHLYFLIPGSTAPLPSPCGPGAKCPSGENGGCCSPGSNGTLRGFEQGAFLNGATSAFVAAVQGGHTTTASINSRYPYKPHSQGAFDAYTEMEAVASQSEVRGMLDRVASTQTYEAMGGLLVFPEDASHEIRMLSFIPLRWAQRGPTNTLRLQGQPAEYLSFQLGLYASTHAVRNITIEFEPMKQTALQAANFSCISCGGLDFHGNPFTKSDVGVTTGRVLPLWMGLMLPSRSVSGLLQYQIHLSYRSEVNPALITQTIGLEIDVPQGSPPLIDHGDRNLSKRTRLRWLNSDRAQDDAPAKPYTPIVLQNGGSVATLDILGRSLMVSSGNCGLPTRIHSWGADLLAQPIQLLLHQHGKWSTVAGAEALHFSKVSSGIVSWTAQCVTEDGQYHMVTSCTLEAEGSLDVKLSVTSHRGSTSPSAESTTLTNATLAIDFNRDNQTSRYKMGFGELGSPLSQAPLRWRWNELLPKRSSMIWVGGGTAGMRLSLKGPESYWQLPMWYGWPSRASNYNPTLAEVPRSWGGDKKDGGCQLGGANMTAVELNAAVPLRCWSNAITFAGKQTVDFHFDLLITPFRDINTMVRERFGIRHYQLGYPISNDDTAPSDIQEKFGSTVIGLHQGTAVNPYISWIFDPHTSRNMSRYTAAAHAANMRVKSYFTVRELSVRSALSELYGLVALGGEVLHRRLDFPDPWEHRDNLGNAWLQQHLLNVPNATEPGYSIAYNLQMPWLQPGFDWDFALHVRGDSRWVNWYIEALHWAVTKGVTSPPDNVTLDGLYLDGFNYDRVTIKRVRKVLDRANPSRKKLIDFHCMQTFHNPYAEYGNVSVALNFMAHFPFIDTLWLGEGFDLGPAVSKEHWLIEQSGILWGQFSEMLAGPNPYKGMLFGETGRAPLVNMKALYELWDMVHIDDMYICGWWNTSALGCPAHTSDTERVPLTTYHCPRCGQSGGPAALLSLASFAPVKLNVSLNIKWPRLGFDASESVLTAPAVAGLQPLRTFQLDEAIPVAPSQGWLLVVTAKTSAKCGTVLANIDLSGHDLAPACAVHASSGSECCHKCWNATAAGCKAWTFISATQQCCLKVSALGRRSLPGHESGCVDAACNLPPPPPPPPPPPFGTPLLPGWEKTYNMSLSTSIEPCNYSGYFDPEFAARFGYVDWDWSNAKNHWENTRPMSCEETLVAAAEETHARNPRSRVFVYRNLVKALPWFTTVREKLDDPAFSGFFLHFHGNASHASRCDNFTGKCSIYYHDQLQTPGEGRLNDRDGLNAGNCSRGGCDCGTQPCGEYLWNHLNGSMLRDFLVNEVIGGPTGIGHPAISGVNIDDFWRWNGQPPGSGPNPPNGPSEVAPEWQSDTGFTEADVEAMHVEWGRTMEAVQVELVKKKKYQAEWFNCPMTPNASTYCWDDAMLPPVNTDMTSCNLECQKAQCVQHMRQYCRPSNESLIHKLAWQYIFTRVSPSQSIKDDGQLPAFEQDLARFLLLRGEYAWLGFSWQQPYCGDAYARPPQLDWDFGQPISDCAEVGDDTEIFARRWSRAHVQLYCKTFVAKIDHVDHKDP